MRRGSPAVTRRPTASPARRGRRDRPRPAGPATSCSASTSTMRWAGPWPWCTVTTRVPARQVAADVGDRRARCRRGRPRPAALPTSRDLAATSAASVGERLAVRVEPERADPPPRLARSSTCVAHLADARAATRRRGRSEPSRPRRQQPSSRRGTPRWWRPGRARGCARARGRAPARGCRAGSSSTSISISSTSAGRERLHPLDGHALRRACR